MTKKDFLIAKYNESHNQYTKTYKEFYTNPSAFRIEPFKIADELYYVGDKKVCVHLIDTGDGLILLDSGFPCAVHLLVDSIWRAGFDPQNVRWIIHTHGHYDHFGASEEFRRMYGTKLAISRVDAELLRKKPGHAQLDNASFPYAEIPTFDYEIEDGEIFRLGNMEIRCVLTPGHTAGVLSLFFNVTYNGNTYLAGLFGGAGINILKLPYMCYNEDNSDCPGQMLSSIEKLLAEPVVIHLGNHPADNNTVEKREKQLKEGGNPFINSDSWSAFLNKRKGSVQQIIRDNAAMEKALNELFNE